MNWIAEEEAGAAEYDRITERQIAERAISTLVEKPDPAEDIMEALLNANREGLRFWSEDIGFLVKIREAFRGNSRVRDLVRHLINLETAESETLAEEIGQWKN